MGRQDGEYSRRIVLWHKILISFDESELTGYTPR
jgi:hypothetical protein